MANWASMWRTTVFAAGADPTVVAPTDTFLVPVDPGTCVASVNGAVASSVVFEIWVNDATLGNWSLFDSRAAARGVLESFSIPPGARAFIRIISMAGAATSLVLGWLPAGSVASSEAVETLLEALATEVTAAAILAKLIAAPSTEAKQTDIITKMASRSDAALATVVNAAVLPAGPTFTATASVAVVAGARRMTWIVSYTKHAGAAGGQWKGKMVWDFGATATGVVESYVDPSSLVVTAPWGILKTFEQHLLSPVFSDAPAHFQLLTFEIPAGATAGVLQLTEVGDVVNRGTVTLFASTSEVM